MRNMSTAMSIFTRGLYTRFLGSSQLKGGMKAQEGDLTAHNERSDVG